MRSVIKLISTEEVTFTKAETQVPTGPSPANVASYLMVVYNSDDTNMVYLVPSGSGDSKSALVVLPGQTVVAGPYAIGMGASGYPDIYSSGAADVLVSWELVVSEV